MGYPVHVWDNIMPHMCMGVPYEYMHDHIAIP